MNILPWNREEIVVGIETVYMSELFVGQQTRNIDKQTINKKKTSKEVITKNMKEKKCFHYSVILRSERRTLERWGKKKYSTIHFNCDKNKNIEKQL